MLKLLQNVAITGGVTAVIQVPAGRYSGIMLRLTGTTAAAQTLSNADVGSVRISRNGRQTHSATWDHFAKMSNLYAGFIEATFPAAGATATSIIVPFALPGAGLPNIAFVSSDTEMTVFLDALAVLATRFGSNAISVSAYGMEEALIAESYALNVSPSNQTFGGAGTFKQQVPGQNTGLLIVEDPGNVVSTIGLEIDGRQTVPNVPDDVLLSYTNAVIGRVEVSGNTLIALPTSMKLGDLSANGNTTAEFTNVSTGAGSLLITAYQILPSNQAAAAASVANASIAQQARGNRLGFPAPRPVGLPVRSR